MSRIIAIANVKGGVGKTTTTGNLAAALAERGRKVLAIDLDPQASLTVAFGVRPEHLTRSVGEALTDQAAPLSSLIVPTRDHFDLAPASHDLRHVERSLENGRMRLFAVRGALEPLRGQYDYVLLDCPPNAGILTDNALVAADEVVIPFPADYLALEALGWLLHIIQDLRRKISPNLHVAGLFLSMYDARLRLAREMVAAANERYGSELPLFSATVRPTVLLRQSVQRGLSILQYAPQSQAALAYRLLAREVEEGIQGLGSEEVLAALRSGKEALTEQDPERAYASYCEATRLDPRRAEGWLGRAQTAAEWYEAVRCYAQVLALAPDSPEARGGMAHHLDGKLQALTAADLPRVMALGQYLAEAGSRAGAGALFRRATELDPSHEQAWLGRARTAASPEEEAQYLQRARELNPDNAGTRQELAAAEQRIRAGAFALIEDGQARMRDGSTAEAHRLFLQATQLDAANEAAWIGCARTSGDMEEGLRFVEQALRVNPNSAEARELHSWLWVPQVEPAPVNRVVPLALSLLIAAAIVLGAVVVIAMMVAR